MTQQTELPDPLPFVSRHSYVPLDKKENFVLIHYMGDSSTAVQFSHGIVKTKTRNHISELVLQFLMQ